jgi:hypothetical protein
VSLEFGENAPWRKHAHEEIPLPEPGNVLAVAGRETNTQALLEVIDLCIGCQHEWPTPNVDAAEVERLRHRNGA